MNSFEIFKIATAQYNKAMKYHNSITFSSQKIDEKYIKERKIQQNEYDKALFLYKLYRAVLKQEELEDKNK